MIPAGLERNKAIAKMRGDRICHDFNLGGTCMYCAIEDTSNAVRDSVCPQKEIKPYSTDISCAMELASEMHSADDRLADKLLHYAFNWWMAGDDSTMGALADAISGSWIKWKEAK